MNDKNMKELLYPKEQSRYLLALIAITPLVIVVCALIAEMGLMGIILALIAAAAVVSFFWFITEIVHAQFLGNAVRVSESTFPEIYQILVEAKNELQYRDAIEAFVYEESKVNAALISLFKRKFILIPSEVVSNKDIMVGNDNEIRWLILRFIGSLKSKHMRLDFLRIIIDSSEKLIIFNLFIYPYERATQYSGDQIGFAITKDLHAAVRMMTKLFVGKHIVDRIHVGSLIAQADEIQGNVFAFLAILISPFPHLADRYWNLLSFAHSRYPQAFSEYLSQLDRVQRKEIIAKFPMPFFEETDIEAISSLNVPQNSPKAVTQG